MRVLFIGGTRFVGAQAVRRLEAAGHRVTVFHRGRHEGDLPSEVEHIHVEETAAVDPSDRRQLRRYRGTFERVGPDVVVDMVAFTSADAAALVRTFSGVAKRVVVPSSIDVYRAYGRLHQTEPGEPDGVPLTEDAPLREKVSVHGEAYEKRDVERIVLGEPTLPATVLRFPAVYGPHDPQWRFREYTQRMLDGREAILVAKAMAGWGWTYGYVDNVAEAVVAAVEQERAAGRVYNVGEPDAVTHVQRVRDLARVLDWKGRIVTLPSNGLPKHLQEDLDWRQDWLVDSSRIRRELGYREAVPYEEGLRRTVEWQRARGEVNVDRSHYAAEDAVLGESVGT